MSARRYAIYRTELVVSVLLTLVATVLAAIAVKVPKGESTEALRVWSAVVAILGLGSGPSLLVAALALRSSERRWWWLQALPVVVLWMLFRALFP